jgi:hypothetical protein
MILRDQPIWCRTPRPTATPKIAPVPTPADATQMPPQLSQPYSKVTQHRKSHHQLMVDQILPELSDSWGKSSYVSYAFIQWKFPRFECVQVAMRDKFSASIIFKKSFWRLLLYPWNACQTSPWSLELGGRRRTPSVRIASAISSAPKRSLKILRINILASLRRLVEVAWRSPTMSEQTITMLRFCHGSAHSVS